MTTATQPTTKTELLEALQEYPEAHELVQNFFNKDKKMRGPKYYQAVIGVALPNSFPKSGYKVFEALETTGQALTLEEWADALGEPVGRGKIVLSQVKQYAKLLLLVGAIQET